MAPQTGPPIAPRITASAVLAAVRASSVKGEPVASIDACVALQSWARKLFLTSLHRLHTHATEQMFSKVEFDVRPLLRDHA